MDSIGEYMATKHGTLANDYRTADMKHSESCSFIAFTLARLLLAEGETPSLMRVRGQPVDGMNRESLVPRPYQGRVRWSGHVVCSLDGQIYDPMVAEKPVAVEEYGPHAFLGEVEMDVFVAEEEIKKFVKR